MNCSTIHAAPHSVCFWDSKGFGFPSVHEQRRGGNLTACCYLPLVMWTPDACISLSSLEFCRCLYILCNHPEVPLYSHNREAAIEKYHNCPIFTVCFDQKKKPCYPIHSWKGARFDTRDEVINCRVQPDPGDLTSNLYTEMYGLCQRDSARFILLTSPSDNIPAHLHDSAVVRHSHIGSTCTCSGGSHFEAHTWTLCYHIECVVTRSLRKRSHNSLITSDYT